MLLADAYLIYRSMGLNVLVATQILSISAADKLFSDMRVADDKYKGIGSVERMTRLGFE